MILQHLSGRDVFTDGAEISQPRVLKYYINIFS